DMSRRVEELMTSEGLVTVPVGTTLEPARDILRSHKVETLPVVDAALHPTGLIPISDPAGRGQSAIAATAPLARRRAAAHAGAAAPTATARASSTRCATARAPTTST